MEPTILRALRVFAFLFSWIGTPAMACSLVGLEHEVAFQSHEVNLSATEIRSLVDWYVKRRDGSLGVLEVTVFALSRKGDAASERETRQRTVAVVDLVRSLSEGHSIPVESRVTGVITPVRKPTRQLL
jgi:hypothetical protein